MNRMRELIKIILHRYLFLIIGVMMSLQVSAQTNHVWLHLDDVTIETAINKIRKVADVNFLFNHEELKKAPKISVHVDDVTIEEALDQILEGTGFEYKKVEGTYVIRPLPPTEDQGSLPDDQPRQSIRGQVFDRDSKATLPYATVQVMDTYPVRGTTTDLDGNFIIEDLIPGRYTLKVSFVGYNDAFVPEILLGSGKETVVSVELTEQVQSLVELLITARHTEPLNEMASVSAQSFNAEQAQRYAASISDPARMALSYAGVSTTDDASNEIVIRGNSPNWLLWRLEGVEIPSPNHFTEEGYSAGAVSILSANMLGSSDFYTGAFPAEYGNALSGVFDINLRNGNNQTYEHTIQVGVLGIDLSSEGPFKKGYDGSYLFNYRYSTFSLLNDLNFEVSENVLPNYQDLSFKINLPTTKAGTFTLWGLGGMSDAIGLYEPDTLAEVEDIIDGYKDVTESGMYAAGFTHTIFTDSESYIKTVISRSSSYSNNSYFSMDSSAQFYESFQDDLGKSAWRITSHYNRKVSNRLTLRAGGVYSQLSYNYYTKDREAANDPWWVYLNSKGETDLYQAFLQSKLKISNNLIFTAGLNYSHFALNADHSFEPRLGLTLGLPNDHKLAFGYGKHTRHESLPVYFVETESVTGELFYPNRNLKLSRAHHFVASYEKLIGEHANFKVEAYYQHIGNLPVSNNPEKYWSPIFGDVVPDDTLANIGEGRNYGLEFTLQKYLSNGYYFLITSSLFDSKYKAADGQWRNTRYNLKYVNNVVAGKEFKWGESKMIGLNAKVMWSGGQRQTPINLEASREKGEAVYYENEAYSLKLDDYFRLDVGARLHFYRPRTEHVIALDIQNTTNRLNTWAEYYNAKEEKITTYPMAGLIPILSYRVEF